MMIGKRNGKTALVVGATGKIAVVVGSQAATGANGALLEGSEKAWRKNNAREMLLPIN